MSYDKIIIEGKGSFYLVPISHINKPKRGVAVIAGHTNTNKGDWSSLFQSYEHDEWNVFIKNYLPDWIDTFEHKADATYTERQKYMAELTKDYDLVIELHWNAFDPDHDGIDNASGVECYVWKGNEKMKKTGDFFTAYMRDAFGLINRGCKPINSGPGAGFLKYTKGDALLLEPLFADNENDVAHFDRQTYADIILKTIDYYYELQNN